MKGKKKEDFDYQNFEQQALKAMYEGKSLEQVLGPLLKRLVEAGLQGEMQTHLEDEKASSLKNRRNERSPATVSVVAAQGRCTACRCPVSPFLKTLIRHTF